MKKLFVIIAAALLSAGIASAQDKAKASEIYNGAIEQLNSGDKITALASFREALQMSQAAGAEDLAANCKKAIPGVLLSIAKQYNNEKKFDEAVNYAEEAAKLAEEYEDFETMGNANELIPRLQSQAAWSKAESLFKAKDYAAAIEAYNAILEADPKNGNAALRIVQANIESGNIDAAKEALAKAQEAGKGKEASSLIGKTYLKKAQTALKGKDYSKALSLAESAGEFLKSPNVNFIAGQAAQNIAGKESTAIQNFEQYLAASPNAKNAGAIACTLGGLYQKQNNKEKALEYFQKAQGLGFPQAEQYIKALK